MSKVNKDRRLKILISSETKEPEMLLLGPIPLTDLTTEYLVLAETMWTSDKHGKLLVKDKTFLYTPKEARETSNRVSLKWINGNDHLLEDINTKSLRSLLDYWYDSEDETQEALLKNWIGEIISLNNLSDSDKLMFSRVSAEYSDKLPIYIARVISIVIFFISLSIEYQFEFYRYHPILWTLAMFISIALVLYVTRSIKSINTNARVAFLLIGAYPIGTLIVQLINMLVGN